MFFEQPGPVNTGQTLKRASKRGRALGHNEGVVASTKGRTAYKALVLKPANPSDLFDIRIREISCKPRNF